MFLRSKAGHPDVITWFAACLWSINDVLTGGEGQKIEPLRMKAIMQDVLDAIIQRAERQESDTSELEDELGI